MGDDDDEDKIEFSDDEADALLDYKPEGGHRSDMFDSLKEDEAAPINIDSDSDGSASPSPPPKKKAAPVAAPKRKLGPKAETVKPAAKKLKKVTTISDSDDDDDYFESKTVRQEFI